MAKREHHVIKRLLKYRVDILTPQIDFVDYIKNMIIINSKFKVKLRGTNIQVDLGFL